MSAPPQLPGLGEVHHAATRAPAVPAAVRAAVRAVRNRGRGLKEAEARVDEALEEEAGHLRRQPPLVRPRLPRKRHPQPRPRAPLVGLCRPPAAPRLEVRQHVPHDLQRPANWPLPGKPPKAVHRDALELVPVVVLQLPQSAQAPRKPAGRRPSARVRHLANALVKWKKKEGRPLPPSAPGG